MRTSSHVLVACLFVGLIANASAANAQGGQAKPSNLVTANGTVVSTTRATLVIRTGEGEYQLFELDRNTTRPATIPAQATVSVSFAPSDDEQPPTADTVRITAPPPAQTAALTGATASPQIDEPVPASIRQMEQDIQRQVGRFRVGVRGGTTLDPELFLIGVHSQLGPFFRDNVWARPNLELGFGEVTTLVALNFEAAYRLPVVQPRSRWNVYVGGGPGLNFAKLGFSAEGEEERDRFDFSDLDLDVGFNIFLGILSRDGLFLELKSSAYAIPRIRFEVGYNF